MYNQISKIIAVILCHYKFMSKKRLLNDSKFFISLQGVDCNLISYMYVGLKNVLETLKSLTFELYKLRQYCVDWLMLQSNICFLKRLKTQIIFFLFYKRYATWLGCIFVLFRWMFLVYCKLWYGLFMLSWTDVGFGLLVISITDKITSI